LKNFRAVWQIKLEKTVKGKDKEHVKTIVENLDCQFDGSYIPDSFEHVKQEETEPGDKIIKNTSDFKAGYNVLMDYWDYFPEDLRPEIDKRLKEVGV